VLTTATMIPKRVERVDDPGSPAPPVGRSFAFGTFFSRPASRRVLIEFFCFAFAFATLTGGFTLFLKHGMNYNVKEAGRIWGFSGLVGLIVQGGLIRPLVKRFGDRKLAAIGFFTMTVGYAVLAFAAGSLPILLVSSGFAGFGIAVVRPCITNLLTQTVSRDEQGAVLGVSQSLTSISQVTAHPTAGLLMEAGRSGMVAWALVAAAFALVGFIVRVRPENPASDPAPA
jgi:DHA1 family tetracycline resistance protein-like MFS transporter